METHNPYTKPSEGESLDPKVLNDLKPKTTQKDNQDCQKIFAYGTWDQINAYKDLGGLTPAFFSPYENQPDTAKENQRWSFSGITYGKTLQELRKILSKSQLTYEISPIDFPNAECERKLAFAASIDIQGRPKKRILQDCDLHNHLVKPKDKKKVLGKTFQTMVAKKEILALDQTHKKTEAQRFILNEKVNPEMWEIGSRLRGQSQLLQSIKDHHQEIEEILGTRQREALKGKKRRIIPSRFDFGEDPFYRFYHQSFKIYYLQKTTEKILELFRKIGKAAGIEDLNPQFLDIITEGTGKTFDTSHNLEWSKHTRPILEAFFHAREMLNFCSKYGKSLSEAPNCLPSGWAAVLYLYNLR